MSLTTLKLEELQTIAGVIADSFPDNTNDEWWAAIRILNANLGPNGPGGQSTFDATVANILATQESIQSYQGKSASHESGFREAVLQIVPDGYNSYFLGETATGGIWIDGKPIFRHVILAPGGSAVTNIIVAELVGIVDTLLPSSGFSGLDVPTRWIANGGSTTNIRTNFNPVDGTVSAFHGGLDFTGNTIIFVLEYTKV